MAKVKIKHPSPCQAIKLKLLEILSVNLIYATRLIPNNDGYTTLTRKEEDIDKIFTEEVSRDLRSNNFTPILPPEIRSKRTVIIFNVDKYIFEHSESEIQQEFQSKNQWIGGIEQIFKFPNKNIMKIQFSNTNAAKKACESGILGFHMSIPEHSIKLEEFIPINTCMRCYKLEDHYTSECQKDKSYKICSECASPEHTWRECKSEVKKCINCGGNHRTLAFKCPEKKKAIEAKTEEKRNKSKQTYSQAAANTMPTPTITNLNIGKDTASTILTCMLHAHFMNMAQPGTYNIEMNKLLKANNLPTVNLPDNPPSFEIINMAHSKVNKATEPDTNKATNQEQRVENTTEKEEVGATTEKETPSNKELDGKDLGLEIFSKQSEGFPQENFSLKALTKGMLKGTYKWTYSNGRYTEDEILKHLNNNEISLRDCWRIVEDQKFKKIRNGYTQQRTPPPNKIRARNESR